MYGLWKECCSFHHPVSWLRPQHVDSQCRQIASFSSLLLYNSSYSALFLSLLQEMFAYVKPWLWKIVIIWRHFLSRFCLYVCVYILILMHLFYIRGKKKKKVLFVYLITVFWQNIEMKHQMNRVVTCCLNETDIS